MKLITALSAAALALTLVGVAAGSAAQPAGADLRLSGVGRPWPGAGPDQPRTFTVEATPVSGFYPGAERSVPVLVRNPYPFDLRITSLGGEVADSSRRDCPAGPANLAAGPHQGELPMTLRALEAREAGSIPFRMPISVTDQCVGVTFTIRITGVATKVNK
ncbi:hypothetical protein DFJ67_2750 [Asanoa ferruginea]|uniref:ML domain-containing protein n=1 Tax=Asanoa ferruginea TaxID=53367 RepID=A0A3D9ZIT2_9ACTN|nr:hypothetical protein [Asanoa ferruginea]REF96759.1 hypothetical protein DFJ67_2750 [Asanoa ferruginea]GIF53381.1 hypothetical protein Afe04nite_79200 [Asanoa ferruginea]